MPSFAAVDLGAQSGRVAVGRFDGSRLSVEVVHRFANTPIRAAGALRWDIARLHSDVLDGLLAVARDTAIDSLSVDSWGVDFALLDRAGELVENPVHYRDPRRRAAFERVLERISPRELYERTGIQLLPINTIFELEAMAASSDPGLASANQLLLIPDLFHYWLCGARTSERTNATTTQCFDPSVGEWAFDLLERLNIPPHLFPEVVPPGTKLGPVSDERSGMVGIPVVAGATHDTAAAVAATPLTENSAFLSVGTWSLVGIESPTPFTDDAAYRTNLTNEGGVDGTLRVLCNVTGLWLLEECRRAWHTAGAHWPLDDLLARAQTAPALRSLIDPNDPIFAAPGDMPARIADYCARTGQPLPEDEGAIVRCILESLALKHAQVIDSVVEVTGRTIEELHVVGGGANNELLCAWTAAATDRPVHAGPAEATLVGNVLVQAIALGELASLAEMRAVVRDSVPISVYTPKTTAAWREARQRFAALSREVAA